jgi:type IV pilus assembly protein PilY1
LNTMKNSLFSKLRLASFLGCITALLPTLACALEDVPVYLKPPAAPNIAITVDDSGSMSWGAVPDGIVNLVGTNRYRASSFNPLAYNPQTTYELPRQASNGLLFPNAFNAAWLNGHLQAGPVDLATQFRRTDSNHVQNGVVENILQVSIAGVNQADPAGAAYYYVRLDLLPSVPPVPPSVVTNPPPVPITPAELIACPVIDVNADACYRKIFVTATSGAPTAAATAGTDERQNYANWFSFYRVRHLVVKTAFMLAMYDVDPAIRISWQGFYNRCGYRGVDGDACTQGYIAGRTYDNQMKPFSNAHRAELYRWLGELPSDTNTPLREAFLSTDQYFRLTNDNSPWLDTPGLAGSANTPKNACRKSYHIALTDGIWNGPGGVAIGNADNSGITLGNGSTNYTARAPYSDATSNTVADIAFRSWANDLQPGIANVIPAKSRNGKKGDPTVRNAALPSAWTDADYWNPRNDPATWQNIVTYTIGLGLGRSLLNPKWEGGTWNSNSAGTSGFATIESGATVWPAAGVNDVTNNPYDLWHAAINGRGGFYSADTAKEVYDAVQKIISDISALNGSAGSVTTSSGYAVISDAAFTSEYDSSSWSGTVLRYPIGEDGSIDAGNARTTSDSNDDPPVLSAFTTSAVAANRKVYTRNAFGGASVEFKWSNLTAANQSLVSHASNDSAMVSYLRGDRSFERGQACEASNTCKFRKREKMLGDILAGSPVLSASEDFGYARATGLGSGQPYIDYLKNTKSSRQKVILVGANDGMFHILNADTLAEMYAYVPRELFGKLWRLTEQIYVKKAFVDGPITIGDAYINGAWGTYGIATLGAGGKSISAFDISNPSAFGSGTGLWEFTDPDLGFVTTKPVITRLSDGKWAVLFSGGFENSDNSAVLYAVELSTGNLLSKTKLTGISDGCSASNNTPNGLGAVSAFTKKDGSANGKVFAYAGDLWGNLWRFQPTASGSGLEVSFGGSPLFKACSSDSKPQAITAAPAVTQFGIEPMVFFGTGRLFEGSDLSSTKKQTFYSVIDDDVTPGTYDRNTRLGVQTVLSTGTATKVVSTNNVNLAEKRGWFLDLTDSKERVVAQPSLIDGRILFPSFIPEDSTCESDGYSWVYNLDALDGSAPRSAVFDTNGDQKISATDQQNASALRVKATLSSLTSIRVTDTPKKSGPNVAPPNPLTPPSSQKMACGKGQVKLVASRVYEKGYTELCTPSATMRSGWRQLR